MAKREPGWLKDQRDAANRDAALVGRALEMSGDYDRIRGIRPVWLTAMLTRHNQAAAESGVTCPHVAGAQVGTVAAWAAASRPGLVACMDCLRAMVVPADREVEEFRCDGCGGEMDEVFPSGYRVGAVVMLMNLCEMCASQLGGRG